MRSTFGGIELAKRSLFAHQTALQTTGHNVANANTHGYTRQVVNLVAARPIEAIGMTKSTVPGQLGQSVEFSSITRVREQFLDDQFRNQNKFYGEWTVRRDTLEKLEAVVNEPSDTGLRQVIGNFWNAWQELSKAPENMTARAVVKESALALTDAFNFTSKQLGDLSFDLTDAVNVKATQINTYTDQIAKLNEQIFRIEGLGDHANDLRDQRDVLVDELSYLVNIDVVELDSGYAIAMGGTSLVEGKEVQTQVDAAGLEAAFVSGDLNTGELYGMLYSRDVIVAKYSDQLNTMAASLATGEVTVTLPKGMVIPEGAVINGVTYEGDVAARTLTEDVTTIVNGINELHQFGYVFGDTLATAPPIFVTRDGSNNFTAGNITLNPDIAANVELLSSSARTYVNEAGEEVVVRGNNDMALLISGIRLQKFDFNSVGSGNSVLNGGTIDEYFRAVVGEIGVQGQEAVRNSDNQRVITEQVDARRQSVSGVSLDEEMANMIKFQHAYNAAARALTTFDEMMDKVINGMGVVGR